MSLENKKILLVDDEPFILSATAQLLRSSGYEVHMCEQWTGVATVVRKERPDLILLDYNMPGIKGDDICRILKKNDLGDQMKIFIYSSEPDDTLPDITMRAGADGYLKKSCPGPVLLERLGSILGVSASA